MANFDINSHYIEEANFSQVKFGEDGYLLEVELNESQQIARNRLKEVVKSDIGSYGIYCQGQYTFDGESLTIKGEKVVVDGEIINILDASLTGLRNGSKVYIQTWDKEVSYLDDLKLGGNEAGEEVVENNIKDPRVGVETSKRYVLSYKLSTTLDNTKKCMELGEVSNGNFISSARSVGESVVTHISHDGTPIKVLNLGGTFFTPPQFVKQQNFNLMQRGVVQDGLYLKDADSTIILSEDIFQIDLHFNIASYASNTLTMLCGIGGGYLGFDNIDKVMTIGATEVSGWSGWLSPKIGDILNTEILLSLKVNKIDKTITLFMDGKQVGQKVATSEIPESLLIRPFTWGNSTYRGSFLYKTSLVYNRFLSSEEIAHNLQVLSQNPALYSIVATDADNNKKEFVFATDSNHDVIQNGYNAEECASGLLNTMGQEFVADENGEIVVENAVEKSKLLGVEIQGRTVKNIHPEITHIGAVVGATTFAVYPRYDQESIKTNTTYTLVIPNKPDYIINGYMIEGTTSLESFHENNYIVFTTRDVFESTNIIHFYSSDGVTEEQVEEIKKLKVMLIEGDISEFANQLEYTPFGLSSTEAALSINGNKYSFYEPTIEGKTEVIDGELVSLEPSIEGLPVLGRAGEIIDTIDIATKVMTLNTKEIVLDGSEEWIKNSSQGSQGFTIFHLTIEDIALSPQLIANNLEYIGANLSSEGIGFVSSVNRIFMLLEGVLEINDLKQRLSANPTTVRYQLAEPITHQLTTEEFNAYDHHKKVICLHGIGDVVDSLTQDKDGNVILTNRILEDTLSINGLTFIPPQIEWNNMYLLRVPLLNAHMSHISEVTHITEVTNPITFSSRHNMNVGDSYISSSSSNMFIAIKQDIEPTIGEVIELLGETFRVVYIAQNPVTTHIDHKATPTIPISSQQINNCLVEVKVDSPVLPSYFSFTHYPSIKSVLNTLTMEELISLSDLSKPFIDYDNAETNLNPTNVGYLSGGFINIPFSLRNRAYVRTEQVKLYDDITLVLVSTTAKELTISKTTENLSLVNVDDNKFILRIPTTEEGVGTVFLTSNSSIGVGVTKGEEVW